MINSAMSCLCHLRQQVDGTDVDLLEQLQDRDRQIVHWEHALTAMQEQLQLTAAQLRYVHSHCKGVLISQTHSGATWSVAAH